MSSNNIEFKAIPGQFNIDEAQGIVECFVAGIGNKDSVGDVLIPGAFTESLKRRKPRVVWGHNWNDPIGKVLEIYEVAPGDVRLPMKMKAAGIGGLYARVQFNLNSEKGREAFANVAFFGQEQEWSIGYKTLDAIHDSALQANILKEVELYEVSPVLHGANQLTGTISVKSDETAEKCGPGMGMHGGVHRGMPSIPGARMVVVRREDEDEDDKPIFAEGLAQPISGDQRTRLAQELQSRIGSGVQLMESTENTAIFRRMMPNGSATVYRIGYHTPDNYRTFMFGKPELADGQVTKPRVVIPSQMPSMPMEVKPGTPTPGAGEQIPSNINIGGMFANEESYEKTAMDAELAEIEQMLSDDFDVKVGRALNGRNLSKLKNIMQSLQEIIAASEKEIDTKSAMIIPVALENAFQTKQLLDPIFDYHRVESEVTEDGILITSPVSEEFVDAVDTAVKALGGRIGGGSGKGRRAARGLSARFDPTAWDGDGDGLVQEGTAFQRPAIPGVNDRATGGRVNPSAASRAFRQEGGMASASWQLPRSQEDSKGIQVLDSQILKERMSGMSLDEAAKKFSIPREQIRQREAREMARLRLESDPRDIVAYRLQGLSLEDTAKMFGKSREEIRQIEAKEIARFKKDTTDADILEYRERGLSLDEVAKISGLEKTEVRKREMAAIRNKPEIPEPDKPMDDDTIRRMQEGMARESGMLSRAEVVQRPQVLQGEIVSGPGSVTPAMKRVKNRVDAGWINPEHQDILDEILSDVTPEKLSGEDAGKVLSNVRKKFFEAVNNGEFDDYRGAKMREDSLKYYLNDQISRVIKQSISESIDANIAKTQDSKRRKLLENNRDDLLDTWGESLDDGLKRLVDNKPVTNKEIASAKKNAAASRSELIDELSNGSSEDDAQYFWDRVFDIITDDPSIDSEEFLKELQDASAKGIKENPDSDSMKKIQGELESDANRFRDLVQEMEDAKLESDYYPDTVQSSRARAGGLLSSSRSDKPVLGRDVSYFEPEEDRSEQFYDMARDVTRAEMSSDYYEMVANTFEGSVFGALNEEKPSPAELEARKQIVDNLDSVIKKAEETIGRPDKAFDRLDEIAKLPKEERLAALRDADLKPNERQILENGLMEDYFAGKKSDLFDDVDKQMVDSIAESMMEDVGDDSPRRGGMRSANSRTMLNRPGQIQRDERGNVDPTEAREARADFDQAIFKKLRDLGFTDDDIETLTGVPNGGIVPEGAKPATYSGRDSGMASRSSAGISKMNDADLRNWANQNLEDSKNRQTRMADMKARGMSMDEIAKEFPTLSRSQIARDIAAGDKKRTSGMRSSSNSSYSLELTGDEFSTLADDLEFMGLDELSDKFREAGKDRDSNQISISPEELDDYISSVDKWAEGKIRDLDANNDTDGGAVANIAGDVSDVLSRLKKSSGKKFTSENVESDSGRKFRAGGSINPHEKLEFGLTEDELGVLLDEMDLFQRTEPGNRVIAQAAEKMKAAKNGKFSFTAEEADELDKELGRIAKENDFTGLDMSGVLGQAADSKDGKLITNGAGRRGLASAAKPGRKPNNGAPMDINEQMQKELIFWAKRNQNLILARKWTDSFDKNDGQLSSSDWRGLETLYNNLSPRGRRGGSRSIAKPQGNGMLSRSVGMRSADDSKPLSPIDRGGPSMTPTGEGRELPTSRVMGLGDIGYRGPAEEGRAVGTMEDPRTVGKTIDELKPSNWDEMGLEEKYEWLFSDGQPSKSGMREVDYSRTLNELLQEEERMERQNARKNRRNQSSSEPSSSREGGMLSRAQDISSRAKEEDMPKKITDLLDSVVKKLNGYEENKDKLPKIPTQSRESGMLSRSMGMPSKAGRTMITDEATYFKSVEDSLAKEISKAREANDSKGADALSTLQQIIRRQEASKLGDRRTNVGSIYFTADEADSILDALMGVVDRQVARNDQKRIEIFAKLVDMMATAAMSTFVDKDTAEVNSRPRSGQVNL